MKIIKFNQLLKEYEQKEQDLKNLISSMENNKNSEEIISKQHSYFDYPFSHHFDNQKDKIRKKWNSFEPQKKVRSIGLLKIGEFQNWLEDKNSNGKEYSQNISVLLPIVTQDKDIEEYRNVIFRNCKDIDILFKNIIVRILTSIPSSKVKLHLFDTLNKGESFIDFSALSPTVIGDNGVHYKEELIYKKLQELHTKVISLKQTISTKYNNIDEYNEIESMEKEPYNFIFISNFPHGFNNKSLELLEDIMKYGNKVGYEIILDLNYKYSITEEINIDSYLNLGFLIDYYRRFNQDIYKFTEHKGLSDYWFNIEEPLDENMIRKIVEKINITIHNKKSEPLSFEKMKEKQNQIINKGIRVPIGFQEEYNQKLYFDLENVYHCLIGGTTGSGKTVLLHTIINSLAYHYSPDEIELYLLDYKEGTEFKIYETLSHLSLLSIASDIIFGISILEKCLTEIEERGSLFKKYKVSNIIDYKEKTKHKLARLVVIIDEFQVLLTGDSKTTAQAKQYIDDIVRRGRSFGIHLILSTQTLQGIDLSNSTKSNTGLRIALKMNPEDASKILSDKNAEKPILLKQGEAIYNDTHGYITSDSLFQVAYLSPAKIKQNLQTIQKYYNSNKKPKIFDGNKLANIYDNKALVNATIQNNKVYIGEANFLAEEHKYFELEDEYGSNIIIVGTNEEDALRVLLPILYSINLQTIETEIYSFNFLKKSNPNKDVFKDLGFNNCDIDYLKETIEDLNEELEERIKEKSDSDKRIILNLFNIHNARILYSEGPLGRENNKILEKLHNIINAGSEYGIHVITYSAMSNHLNNFKFNLQNFDIKIAVQGGNSEKLFNQTLSTVNISKDTAIISEQLESFRLYDFNKIKEMINKC